MINVASRKEKIKFLPGLYFCLILLLGIFSTQLSVAVEAIAIIFVLLSILLNLLARKKHIKCDYRFLCCCYVLYLILFHFNFSHLGVTIGAIAPWCFLPFVSRLNIKSKTNKLMLIRFVGFAGLVLSVMMLFTHDFAVKEQVGIIGSIAVNANIVSYILGISCVAYLYLAIFHQQRWKLLYFIFSFILLVVIFLCGSRGALLATAVSIVWLLYCAQKRKIKYYKFYRYCLVICIVIAIMFMIVYSMRKGMTFFDNNGRAPLWEEAFRRWQHSPIIGNGLYQIYGEHPSSHNLFTDVLAQSGLIGICLLIAILVSIFFHIKRESKAFFIFAFLQAMIDTRQYYIIGIALMLGIISNGILRQRGVK